MSQNNPLWLVIFASFIALIPLAVGILTSYVKVNIILGFLKSGLGAQQVPGNLVMMALSMSLTAFIMSPVITETMEIGKKLDTKVFENSPELKDYEKFTPVFEPWKAFMHSHSGKKELGMLVELDKERNKKPQTKTEVPAAVTLETLPAAPASAPLVKEEKPPEEIPSLRIIMPAFVLTEVKASFMMGFMVLLPFLVIDLVVANVLAGMGMYMLSPVIVSLPLKLILFVMCDGWLLLTKGIIQSY